MSRAPRRWTADEDSVLREEVDNQLAASKDGEVKDWNKIAQKIPGRSNKDCRKRYYNEVTGGLKKGAWTKEEDVRLEGYVAQYGPAWSVIAPKMQSRSADQCSKRWTHCLDPSLDHSSWTDEESRCLLIATKTHGSSWKEIQKLHMPGRSANNLKNQYKLLQRKGSRVPSNAPSCCPGVDHEMTGTGSGNSPGSAESISDYTALLDSGDDNDFSSELSSFDPSTLARQKLDCIPPSLLESGLPGQETPSSTGSLPHPLPDTNAPEWINQASVGLAAGVTALPGTNQSTHFDQQLFQQHQNLLGEFGLQADAEAEINNLLAPINGGGMSTLSNANADAGNTTTRITLENIERYTLATVMNILINSKASVKLEMMQNEEGL